YTFGRLLCCFLSTKPQCYISARLPEVNASTAYDAESHRETTITRGIRAIVADTPGCYIALISVTSREALLQPKCN
ncbi:hypothetical protein, partial [uncultured Muribaculum sp.]|uniref:hypothetical protein n=1 Tax=uncultured Muribaculum sp. TaxID=1918613 RepID=UPI002711DA41